MPRKKLSEYRSKLIVHEALDIPYVGWSVKGAAPPKGIKSHDGYVVKVDQAVKGRFKRGLVQLNVPKSGIKDVLKSLSKQGFDRFIVEPFMTHQASDERYLSLVRLRNGVAMSISRSGGVDIESNHDSIEQVMIDEKTNWESLSEKTSLPPNKLQALVAVFNKNHMSFLEINPYTTFDGRLQILDLAVEVDDVAASLVDGWSMGDIREPKKTLTESETAVRALDKGSAASFNLSVINPEGAIFLLLSGGGASVVIADEIYNRGFGHELANYGEYSGAPTTHETEKYTSEVLKLLLASRGKKKVLFIGGAVANFTDIATTFAGVIAAFDKYAKELRKHDVTVFVRRGGPRQEIGLENMRKALDRLNILGGVYGPSVSINDALGEALEGLKK